MGITHEWSGTVLTITSDSGTSSADLKGEKGDDGARGVQGAQGVVDTSVLNNYAKKFNFSIAPNKTATITFNHITLALISAVGTSGKLYGTYVYNGYGTGGTDRVHIGEIQSGDYLSYQIKEVSDNETNGLYLSNTNTSNTCYVSILVMYGGEPTVEIEDTVVATE